MNAKSNEMTDRAMKFTKVVTERWDDRLTGRPACAACGDHIYETLGEFCDQTEYQDFPVRPGSFLGFIRINVVLFFVALIALWMDWLLVSAIVTAVAMVILVLQFFFYWELIDFLFPKRNARNVWGTIEPSGRVEQQIYVTAHHDSAHVFNFLQSNAKWYSVRIFAGMGVLVAMTATCWLLLLGRVIGIQMDPIGIVACGIFTLVSPAVLMLWFFYSDQGTPGAGDDLICTAVSLEIGKYFAERRESNEGLRHTRVVIGSLGCRRSWFAWSQGVCQATSQTVGRGRNL